MRALNIFFIGLVCCPLILSGCNRVEKFGETFSSDETVSIQDILKNPEYFQGKNVKVAGEIANECPTGCWFNMKDGDNLLYVNLSPSGFAIPQRVGKDVIAEGGVRVEKNNVSFVARGVQIK